LRGGAVEDRIDYFERMLADNPDNPTGLLALANEYGKAERFEDEAAVLESYLAKHERERTLRQHTSQIRFASTLTEHGIGQLQLDIARV
jgi:thioredoxin-like negative regulator of GroEL